MLVIAMIVLTLVLLAAGNQDHQAQIKEKMVAAGIIPNLLPVAPPARLYVSYPDGKVQLGNELTPTEVKDEPQVSWHANPQKFYTLIMFDPDAPSRRSPLFGPVKHWLVGNIPGADVSQGDVIAEYLGSGPPKGTGLHRYIFAAYEQKGRIAFEEPRSEKNSRAHRLKWSVNHFLNKYGLGDPVAGDFFVAQWDAFVDERNKNVNNH